MAALAIRELEQGGSYPLALERRYPHVFSKIVGLWNRPSIEAYFSNLLVDDRGDRRGFPDEVTEEIHYIRAVSRNQAGFKSGNPWGYQRQAIRQEIERHQLPFTAQGFYKACAEGEERVVDLFIHAGINVNVPDPRGWTGLMFAALHGHTEMVALLLKHGADVNQRNKLGCTALYWAAYGGYVKATQILLSNGADVSLANEHGWTPLLQAAARGRLQICWMLLQRGADVNAKSDDGWTALHKAAASGNLPEVILLLSKGADVMAQYTDGSTALDLAAKNGHQAVVDELFKAHVAHR